ncbi:MAG: hypothetical protein QOF32_399, partial [Gammaproteobacteria bacterium]|nr:hypothetical protein [Gammaproteobacteria bacterium]
MMQTEELIETLAKDVRAVPRHAVGLRIILGIVSGGAISLLLVATVLGIRSDLGDAMHDFAFWVRWIYTASLGVCAVIVTANLARPDRERSRSFWLLAIPFLLLMGIGIAEMAHA